MIVENGVLKYMSAEDCPKISTHAKSPSDYGQWHSWAAKKSKRHKQIRCPECGYFAIWVRLDENEPDYSGHDDIREMAEEL